MDLEENEYKDNFTKEGDKTNLNINKLEVDCITSNQNNFSLDELGNLKVKSITTIEPLIGMLYPIGAIYLSTNSVSPKEYFGGSWVQIKEKFLFGCGENYLNGTTGGEIKHTLTIEEMPKHKHTIDDPFYKFSELTYGLNGEVYKGDRFQENTLSTDETGGNKSHNNMPPYLAVYIWKRVA